jgi:hypothetical protein
MDVETRTLIAGGLELARPLGALMGPGTAVLAGPRRLRDWPWPGPGILGPGLGGPPPPPPGPLLGELLAGTRGAREVLLCYPPGPGHEALALRLARSLGLAGALRATLRDLSPAGLCLALAGARPPDQALARSHEAAMALNRLVAWPAAGFLRAATGRELPVSLHMSPLLGFLCRGREALPSPRPGPSYGAEVEVGWPGGGRRSFAARWETSAWLGQRTVQAAMGAVAAEDLEVSSVSLGPAGGGPRASFSLAELALEAERRHGLGPGETFGWLAFLFRRALISWPFGGRPAGGPPGQGGGGGLALFQDGTPRCVGDGQGARSLEPPARLVYRLVEDRLAPEGWAGAAGTVTTVILRDRAGGFVYRASWPAGEGPGDLRPGQRLAAGSGRLVTVEPGPRPSPSPAGLLLALDRLGLLTPLEALSAMADLRRRRCLVDRRGATLPTPAGRRADAILGDLSFCRPGHALETRARLREAALGGEGCEPVEEILRQEIGLCRRELRLLARRLPRLSRSLAPLPAGPAWRGPAREGAGGMARGAGARAFRAPGPDGRRRPRVDRPGPAGLNVAAAGPAGGKAPGARGPQRRRKED